MNKTQLRLTAGLSTNVLAKLSKNDIVSMESLIRICNALNCDIGDIVEVVVDTCQPEKANGQLSSEPTQLIVAEKTSKYETE